MVHATRHYSVALATAAAVLVSGGVMAEGTTSPVVRYKATSVSVSAVSIPSGTPIVVKTETKAETKTESAGGEAKPVTLPSGTKYIDEVVGTGPEAKNGSSLSVHYTGTLENGKQFDTSRGRGPFTLTLGQHQVIKGWEEGLLGMKKGGKRKLIIPGDQGYGQRGAPPDIPPNATLIFETELMDVK